MAATTEYAISKMMVVGSLGLEQTSREALRLIENAKSSNTKRGYASDWRAFENWCNTHRISSLPVSVETIALYLTAQKDILKVSTLQRRVSSISQAHRMAGYASISLREEPLHTLW